MFRKPFKVKNDVPMKGYDRKTPRTEGNANAATTVSSEMTGNDDHESVCQKDSKNPNTAKTTEGNNDSDYGDSIDNCVEQLSDAKLTERDIEMDDLLRYTCLKALKTSVKQVKLPLIISNFYKVHMIPACPQGYELNVKNSRFKKISKFIQTMIDEGVIECKEISNGVQGITAVHYSHNSLREFNDTYTTEQSSVTNESSGFQAAVVPPKVCEKYTVTHAVLPLFQEFLIKKGNSLTPHDTRRYITEYIKKKNLSSKNTPLVTLDDVLKSILHRPDSSDNEDAMPWEAVIKGVLNRMGQSYKISKSEDELPTKERKGKLPFIDIHVVRKSGNKKVTTIDNLEQYNVNITEFARECQIGAAASATINTIPYLKSAQVQVQGNQVNTVTKLLTGEKYMIPAKYIRDLDQAGGKDKKEKKKK